MGHHCGAKKEINIVKKRHHKESIKKSFPYTKHEKRKVKSVSDEKIEIENKIDKKKIKSDKKQINRTLKKSFKLDKYQIILILILLSAFFVRCYEIDEPFYGHWSFVNAHSALEARNYLEYGYWNTKFGPVDSISYTPELEYNYYLHHPPLRPLLLSVGFLVFGVYEWSARMIGVIFSIFSIFLIYLIGMRVRNKKTGLIAAFFASFMPMAIYYSKTNFYEVFAQFAILLTFYAYISWIKTKNDRYFVLGILSVLFGGFTEWSFYFLMPGIFLHYLIYRKRINLDWKKFVIFFVSFVFVGVLALGHLIYLSGSINKLVTALTGKHQHDALTFTMVEFFGLHYQRFLDFFTPVVCVLSLIGLLYILYLIYKKEDVFLLSSLSSLFIVAILYVGLFSQWSWDHDFWIYYFAFPMALLSAFGLNLLINLVGIFNDYFLNKKIILKISIALYIFLICCVFYIFLVQGHSFTKHLHDDSWDFSSYEKGVVLGNIIGDKDKILLSFKHYSIPYYSNIQESIPEVRSIHYLKTFLNDELSNYTYFVISNDKKYFELNNYLFSNYKLLDHNSTIIFDLREEPDNNTFNKIYNPQYPTKINYNNQIEFLGYDLDYKKENKTFIEKYISGYDDRNFKITYYWKSMKPTNESYKVFVHFVNESGNIAFQQDHEPFYRLYNTSKWKAGEIIKETYNVYIWDNVKPDTYFIKVGLYNEKGRLKIISNQNYRFLNQTPIIQYPKSIIYNNTFEFLGYDLDKIKIEDEKFEITYYWKSLEEVNKDYILFVHFLNESGKIAFQNDHNPPVPTSNWIVGQILKETQTVNIPKDVDISNYSLFLGAYIPDDGRLPITKHKTEIDKSLDKILIINPNITYKTFGNYENKIAFLGYDIDKNTVEKSDSFKITYFWKSLDHVDINYTIFVHFIDKNNKIRFQQDHEPTYGIYPTSVWNPGDIIKEEYDVILPTNVAEGTYRIKIGLYNKETKKRIDLTDGKDSQIIGNITVEKSEDYIFEIIAKTEYSKPKVTLDDTGIVGTIEVK